MAVLCGFGRAKIGSDCNINAHVFIENDVVIGDRVTVKPGVQIWDGIEIGDDVFIGPNVTFTNDLIPRSKVYPTEFKRTLLKMGCSVGANTTILPGVTIGLYAMIGAASVLTKDVPDRALVYGNPAKIQAWVDENGVKMARIDNDKWKDQKGIIWVCKGNNILINDSIS